jgi:hypothetical protein
MFTQTMQLYDCLWNALRRLEPAHLEAWVYAAPLPILQEMHRFIHYHSHTNTEAFKAISKELARKSQPQILP